MKTEIATRFATKFLAVSLFVMYAIFGWMMWTLDAPVWVIGVYAWTGAASLFLKAHYVGIPGTRRFRENILA